LLTLLLAPLQHLRAFCAPLQAQLAAPLLLTLLHPPLENSTLHLPLPLAPQPPQPECYALQLPNQTLQATHVSPPTLEPLRLTSEPLASGLLQHAPLSSTATPQPPTVSTAEAVSTRIRVRLQTSTAFGGQLLTLLLAPPQHLRAFCAPLQAQLAAPLHLAALHPPLENSTLQQVLPLAPQPLPLASCAQAQLLPPTTPLPLPPTLPQLLPPVRVLPWVLPAIQPTRPLSFLWSQLSLALP